MDDFNGLLSRDFGVRPQGKSAPMAASRGSGSGRASAATGSMSSYPASSDKQKPTWESSIHGESSPLDHGFSSFGSGNSKDHGGGLSGLDGIFGAPNNRAASSSPPPSYGYDSVFGSYKDRDPPKPPSPPIYDKPVYDDDLFDGVPGMTSSSSSKFDDVFATLSSSTNNKSAPAYDDLLGSLSGKEKKPTDDLLGSLSGKEKKPAVVSERRGLSDFDDLIPGFSGSRPPPKRNYTEAVREHSSTASNSAVVQDDPFADLGSVIPADFSSGVFVDPLGDINVQIGSATSNNHSVGGFDEFQSLKDFKKPTHDSSSDANVRKNSKYTKENSSVLEEPNDRPSSWGSADVTSNVDPNDIQQEADTPLFDIPVETLKTNTYSEKHVNTTHNHYKMDNEEGHQETEDIWLSVSEVPLFTQPTGAPPPSRLPPPLLKQSSFPHADKSFSYNSKSGKNASTFSSHAENHAFFSPANSTSKTLNVTTVDDLEEFAMRRPQSNTADHASTFTTEEELQTNSAAASSAAAMKEAMNWAEAKFKHAREIREREKESRFGKSTRDSVPQGRSEDITDFHNQEPDEHELREREEKEREQKQMEREKEKELERQREKAYVERALRETRERAAADARERAAVEARQKAQRAAVEKANAEARDRAARAAVHRATAEARERAAAEAREKAASEARAAAEARERAAAEAKEKAAREAREREARERSVNQARERASVERATADARARAERAAVERAQAEARERAAVAAREKLYKNNQQAAKNENDLDSFFGMGSRASSQPKQRTPVDLFDVQSQNQGDSTSRRVPSSNSSSLRKTSSATNILDDLTSVFGAPSSSSGDFQDIEGESEERRRARLERHQRTLERAAKALAEKNERDNQIQREQAERHRFGESLDFEIKRWSAGKEGNLRALLSTLQYVLWPECGWQPVSLTDLITAAAVKKVYRKATLCIHPDKVQQKGATLQQKYVAEKVFDLLKESWNKFNSEELF